MQRPPAKTAAERKRRQWAKKSARRAIKVAAVERARLALVETSGAVWSVGEP